MQLFLEVAMKRLNNIARCQAAYRRSRLNLDIPPSRHAYVLSICREPGRTQDELSADICVNKSTVARVLDSLEELGYVRRTPSEEDKRCLLVYPTDKMLEILPLIKDVTESWNRRITEGIAQDELEIFNSVLEKMEERARALVEI